MTYRKKLIEVALPLVAINAASAKEKSIRHGHPSTLHLWWARRPLATCRAVLFASLVDDPSSLPEQFPTEDAQDAERQRLFRIIEELVLWENSNNERVLGMARAEILRSTGGHPPPVLDPFCGGGSIPLEAQRLGLEAHGSDLNPVAVLITKALIEIPPKWAGRPPVNPEARRKLGGGGAWKGAAGLAEDVRYYGQWMRNEAQRRIGHLYPKVRLPMEQGGEATVIAWLWTHDVRCPNPACGIKMPLLTTFVLSSKNGKHTYLIPQVVGKQVSFSVSHQPPVGYEEPKKGLKRGMSGIFQCVSCGSVTTRDYVSEEGKANRLGVMQTALVVEGPRGRFYLAAPAGIDIGNIPDIDSTGLEGELAHNPRDVWCRNFGLNRPVDLFTPRQLVTLTTLTTLVSAAREQARRDAVAAGIVADSVSLEDDGRGASAYADAVATYLALGVSKLADYNSSLVLWSPTRDQAKGTFARQALPMVWDFTEVNPFAEAAGDLAVTLAGICETLERHIPTTRRGLVRQAAAQLAPIPQACCISTDPPYYGIVLEEVRTRRNVFLKMA